MDKPRALIIDDEDSIRDGCTQILIPMGYLVDSTGDALKGLELALGDAYDIILLDIRMPGMDGTEILKKIKEHGGISARVIVITGYGTIPLAVESMRLGSSNFLTKPFSPDELRTTVDEALTRKQKDPGGSMLVGRSSYIEELKSTIRKIASSESFVLITGESGTGKELVARIIHETSSRSGNTFVPVDCSALVENLMESELFGHVKGAFSGATETRDGRFQMADNGTLFLDEISNISLNIQTKLLRAIQEQEIPRVGSSKSDKVDVRLITATNRDLLEEMESGRFREDLFYRISVIPLNIKPLREHKEDITVIAEHYLEIYNQKHEGRPRRFSKDAEKSFLSYSWPGNIRELKNTVERLCVLCDNEEITQSDILYYGQHMSSKAPVADYSSGRMTLVDVEREHIVKALRHFDFQIAKTASFLGIDRKTLRTKIRNYNITEE